VVEKRLSEIAERLENGHSWVLLELRTELL